MQQKNFVLKCWISSPLILLLLLFIASVPFKFILAGFMLNGAVSGSWVSFHFFCQVYPLPAGNDDHITVHCWFAVGAAGAWSVSLSLSMCWFPHQLAVSTVQWGLCPMCGDVNSRCTCSGVIGCPVVFLSCPALFAYCCQLLMLELAICPLSVYMGVCVFLCVCVCITTFLLSLWTSVVLHLSVVVPPPQPPPPPQQHHVVPSPPPPTTT